MAEPRQQTRNAGKSNLKAFDHTPADKDLKLAIYQWRREEARKQFLPNILSIYGTKLLMTNDIIDRLVKCFHWKKDLKDTVDLQRETGWTYESDWLEVHGPSLLTLITQHRMLQDPPLPLPGNDKEPPKKQKCCTRCLQPGHYRESIGQTLTLR
ncbi:hypothetical protein C0991_003752 [Blastosporella zonata]|nr:hypothetical protein C0991_003752 [Blastosporella zonata]